VSEDRRDRILEILKTKGPQTASVLAGWLEITVPGVRRHLDVLAKRGMIQSFDSAETVGRPKQIWRLSRQGHGAFPDRHGDLSVQLIDQVKQVFGDKGMDQLIEAREGQMLKDYGRALEGIDDLGERVKQLATIRSREGYMAEARLGQEGEWLLIENHCPICDAAKACLQFCRSELRIFRECLNARVERVEYLLQGSRRCAYSIWEI